MGISAVAAVSAAADVPTANFFSSLSLFSFFTHLYSKQGYNKLFNILRS